jgi:hypothetical protein
MHRPARLVALLMAVFVVTGMASLVFMLATEPLTSRETLFFGAAIIAMGFFLWACVPAARARPAPKAWGSRVLMAVYAVNLACLAWLLIAESASPLALGGFLVAGHLCAWVMFGAPRFSGR